MEPVFTLPYSEYVAANRLTHFYKPRAGYSLFVPTSRQEKGIDLLLTKRIGTDLKCASFQVKSSRTYSPMPAKRKSTIRFSYYTWFNTFQVPNQADFFLLVGIYPPENHRTRKASYTWWENVLLIFTQAEMHSFIASVKTRGGNPDKMFGFGFDDAAKIVLTRGDMSRSMQDYSSHLFENKRFEIDSFFA